jgi:NAD(P)-dependent dehydrogenase (short-subunit alcohol dehydrogenase family)
MQNDNRATPASPDTRLDGMHALVVGGSGGIGGAVAGALAEAGASLTIHGRDPSRLARKAGALRLAGVRVDTIQADLSDGRPLEALVQAARTCDLLVVAYGPFVHKALARTTSDDWRLVSLACLALPGIIATEAAAAMAARGFGRILLFGGTRTDTVRGFLANAAYASAKTGLGVLVKSIAAEYGKAGVAAGLVCPGLVDTEYLDEETRVHLAAVSPHGRLIAPEAIASLALSLLSGGMDLANGSIITADEGLYSL